MTDKLKIFKKRLIYRASYRGTKEMDVLLGSFVNKYINDFDKTLLVKLENFLNLEDEILSNYYYRGIKRKKIDENEITKLFKKFKI